MTEQRYVITRDQLPMAYPWLETVLISVAYHEAVGWMKDWFGFTLPGWFGFLVAGFLAVQWITCFFAIRKETPMRVSGVPISDSVEMSSVKEVSEPPPL